MDRSRKVLFLLFYFFLASINTYAQLFNDRPVIRDQVPLSTNEDEPITVLLTHLTVEDRDDSYPEDFTLRIYSGSNYTFSGNTITPALNFNGYLTVPVSVNDGRIDSKRYNLRIQVIPVNDPPIITGQTSISINEEQPIAIGFAHLRVSDPDNNYPQGFTMSVATGTNYSVSGNTVTPSLNFAGMLSINVKVSDGQSESNSYTLQIQVNPVNDPPVITEHSPLTTDVNTPITLQLQHLTVVDPDNPYPQGFVLTVLSGSNYTFSGTTVRPSQDFIGILSVKVIVNDGASNSAPFTVQIEVKPINAKPKITGQVPLTIDEDESFVLQLSHLTVVDPDNFPDEFTFTVLSGANYTVDRGNTIIPAPNFYGNLIVKVTVSDGTNTSAPFDVLITVISVNDLPEITKIEAPSIKYEIGSDPVIITREFEATDIDNEHLLMAEIGFKKENYRGGDDDLIFNNTKNIQGTYHPEVGVLFLIGRATIAEYIEAIRSVKYNCLNINNPVIETKYISITLNDGTDKSVPAERQVRLVPMSLPLDIPTGFTPNGDYANDTWSIKPLKSIDQLKEILIRVFDKRGRLVYEAKGFDEGWDGKLNEIELPGDTYYYIIDLDLEYSKASYKGSVTILR